ncbi:MAG TPA: GxxExxY protein [Vicinamibacterales bacterium]
MDHDYRVTGLVIGCAIKVHKQLGPGLKEASYHAALCEALRSDDIQFRSRQKVDVFYNGAPAGSYAPDLIVENTVVVEIKAVERLTPLFTSQLISYLKITGLRVGLILNFNCSKMTEGIKRVVL